MLSVILPAYNEEEHIKDVIEKADSIMQKVGLRYELIVVNDGSRDDTETRVFDYARINGHVKVVSYHENVGKGYAVKAGFSKAVGDIVIFLDSDLDIDPEQVTRYIDALKHVDIATASKKHPQSHIESPFMRKFFSLGFNILVRLLTGLKVGDTQAGMKAVRKEPMEKVFAALSVKRFAFDAELLVVANLYGLKIMEMPVQIKLKNGSIGIREMYRMFIDLLGIAYRLKCKYYLNYDSNNGQ
jgi:glycosyltransferase involved in cell wall biosynthesis